MSLVSSQTPASSGPWTIVFGLFAAGNLANGLWMLANPGHWYIHLPANVPGSGPLNEHFVRDIGCIFALIGIVLAVGAFKPRFRLTALLFATGFYGAHALVHVYDSLRGLFPPGQWRYDLVPVYGTTLLLVVLSAWLAWSDRAGRSARSE